MSEIDKTHPTLSMCHQVFLESLVDRYHHPMGKIKFQYTLVTEDSVTEGNQIMARWSMETLNARQCGARIELHQQGMLFCKFNSAHKIVTLDIMVSALFLCWRVLTLFCPDRNLFDLFVSSSLMSWHSCCKSKWQWDSRISMMWPSLAQFRDVKSHLTIRWS